jgi:zinc transporter ZupT
MEYIYQFAVVIASLAAGGGLVYAVNWLKAQLGATGNAARALTFVTAVIVAVAIGLVEGVITAEFAPESISVILLYVIGASQLWYRKISGE